MESIHLPTDQASTALPLIADTGSRLYPVSNQEKIINPKLEHSTAISMVSFAGDLPNICSLAGLLSAVLGIYFAIRGNFPVAIIGVLWAVVFDWTDGIVARQIKGRKDHQRAFGGQLDSMIDIVSFGVFPAVFLFSYGNFNSWFIPGAFIIVAASAIRLSYFNIFGLVDSKTYMGLALDNNVIILAVAFLFEGFFSQTIFSIVLYTLLIGLSVLNLSMIKTPKLTGKWFYVLIGFTSVLTVIFALIAVIQGIPAWTHP